MGQPQFSTALPRDFHGVTPTFPRRSAEFSTALCQRPEIRGFIEGNKRPFSELSAVALHVLITAILLCYDEIERKSSEIGDRKNDCMGYSENLLGSLWVVIFALAECREPSAESRFPVPPAAGDSPAPGLAFACLRARAPVESPLR